MEKMKIKISEVEEVTLQIPTELTQEEFIKLYEQMQAIERIIPNTMSFAPATRSPKTTGTILSIARFNEEERTEILKAWENEGKGATVNLIKSITGDELSNEEVSKLSKLIGKIRFNNRRRARLS